MPYCPQCLSEYREGFTRCADCDVELVDQLGEELELSEEAIQQALEGKELIEVARGELEVVKEVRALLSSQRVASIILEDKETKVPEGMAPRVVLVVAKHELDRARQVLGEKFKQMVETEGVGAAPELEYGKCPACGTEVPDDTEECPECGLFIGAAG
ncbi:MAG: hypothetical protein D6806_16165 [Deltaproteobacteria bacterium]|nr:MAG: hypothetical protein D6806_16165 [Deltaproteobacteria bacterium]